MATRSVDAHVVDRTRVRSVRPVALALLFAGILAGALLHVRLTPAYGQSNQGDSNEEIVFIDSGGFLRVYDFVNNGIAIRWFSPIGNFTTAALGDVNADGDMEIIGVRGGIDDGQLVIYDPVVQDQTGVIPIDGYINGVPWTTLYTSATIGEPTLVDAGELVLEALGDEIVYGARINDAIAVDDDAIYQLTTLQGTTDPPTGLAWRTIVEQVEYDEEWTSMAVGDLDNQGTDEIALVAYEEGWLRVYRDLLADPFFLRENQSRPWRQVVIGPFNGRERNDLLAIRNSNPGIDNFWAFQYVSGRWRDMYFESFFPPPEALFLADVEGSGGQEAFMLRSIPTNITNRPRLFSRDELGRSILEDALNNSDNRFQAGAGGNIDGDFGDEVVIIRNNRIRIYTEPRSNATFQEVEVSTNSRTVLIGNLDAGVFQSPPRLAVNNADSEDIVATLEQGIVQDEADLSSQVLVSNATSDRIIPFTFTVDEQLGLPPGWITVQATQLQTPATLNILFDTTRLAPGSYSTTIRIRSGDADPSNQPVRVFVTLTVQAGISVLPNPGLFIYAPCAPPLAPQEKTFSVLGPFGLDFAVGIGNGAPVEWATVAPTGGTIPSSFTVRIDPAPLADANLLETTLNVVPTTDGGGFAPRSVPLYVLCAQSQPALPIIRR